MLILYGTATAELGGSLAYGLTGSGIVTLASSAIISGADLAYEFYPDGVAILDGSANVTTHYQWAPSNPFSGGFDTGFVCATIYATGTSESVGSQSFDGQGPLGLNGSAGYSGTAVYSVTGSGEITVTGSSSGDFTYTFVHDGAGATTVGGTATLQAHYDFVPGGPYSDGFGSGFGSAKSELSGVAAYSGSAIHRGQGTLNVTGSATSFDESSYSVSGLGTMTLSGSSHTSFTYSYSHSSQGTTTLGGSARLQAHYHNDPSGTVQFGGDGNPITHYVFVPGRAFSSDFGNSFESPSIYLRGEIILNSLQATAQGSVEVGGSAELSATYITTGEGNIYFVRPYVPELDGTVVVAPIFSASVTVEPGLDADLSIEPMLAEVTT